MCSNHRARHGPMPLRKSIGRVQCQPSASRRDRLSSMSKDKSWLVFISVENFEHNSCVDLFSRPDESCGFEEFRREVEDRGDWTPVQYYSGLVYASREAALAAAQSVAWLPDAIRQSPSAQNCCAVIAANPTLTRCRLMAHRVVLPSAAMLSFPEIIGHQTGFRNTHFIEIAPGQARRQRKTSLRKAAAVKQFRCG